MKNVTFSADENLIEQASRYARSQNKTLNDVFQEWLAQYTAQAEVGREFDALMERLRHVRPGRRFTREERNER